MIILIRCVLSVLIFSACSASWHLKKARRLDPSSFKTDTLTQVDTVVIEVPTIIEKVRLDTLVEIVQIDPITKIETIIKYKIQNDTIMIDCPDNEVITITETVTNTIEIKPSFWDNLKYGFYMMIGLGVIFGVKKFFF